MRFGISLVLLFIFAVPAFAQSTLQSFRPSNSKSVSDLSALSNNLKEFSVNDALIAHFDPKTALDPRIVGGDPADIKDSPWQVALIFGKYKDPFRAQFCGGSVIGDHWVVAAAHCVSGSPINDSPSSVDVVANTTFFANGGDRIGVAKIIVNDSYNPTTNDFDIALLKLTDTDHTSPLNPVALPIAGEILPVGTNLIVTGWGAQRENGTGSAYLISASIPTVSNATCNAPGSYNNAITGNMICAGLREGGLDSCQGDSGGPAIAVDGSKPVLMGIVSFGDGCARRLKYGVYTDVRQFVSWINDNTK